MDTVSVSGRSILEWNESEVHSWLSDLGFPQYENQIKEHNISGDVLCMLDPEGLKSIGVSTVGQRLSILKAVYQAKVAYNVPFEAEHYVPPSEAQVRQANITLENLHDQMKEQAQRLNLLEEENRRLNETLQLVLDEFNHLRGSQPRQEEGTLRRQPSFKWAQYEKPTKSPTKAEIIESPHPSPQQLEHDVSYNRNMSQQPQVSTPTAVDRSRTQNQLSAESPNSALHSASSSKSQRQESSDNLKGFKVSLEDPTWKVLPAALKKYKINNDNWQNYAMFICYGSAGNRIERCLSYDEKPLLLFQKLKDAKKNPVFMLKHIKDIRSPIVIAQQKHALRKGSISAEASSSNVGSGKLAATGQGRTSARPPRLEVHDLSAPLPLSTGTTSHAGWPEVMSPSLDNKERAEEIGSNSASPGYGAGNSAGTSGSNGSSDGLRSRPTVGPDADAYSGTSNREMPVSTSISYAVAIYPYMAEQEDEFDVVVGDTFVILSRVRGWWVVQRDPTGSGVVDPDTSKQGWVPAGCLLETNVPVASAIAEATAAKNAGDSSSLPSSPSTKKTPILPLSIISTSFPGIALTDYKKKGEEELDLAKDELLKVFKRYNHWSYAVKEDGGDRGWVPSWYIGKVPTPGGTPSTPSTSSVPTLNPPSSALDGDPSNAAQISPMSSAFPIQN